MSGHNEKHDPVLTAFKPFEHFCKAMLDGFVVVNRDGKVVKSNPIITQISGMTGKQLLNAASLDDIFTFSAGNKSLQVKNILSHNAPTRFDEVACQRQNGKALNLIIGYYPFLDGADVIGAWILLRDVTAETELQDKYKEKATKSITDPMTGLFNRAHFEEYMKAQDATLITLPKESDHRNLSVIMGDIDFFKKINDKFGHPAGDYVIKSVAGIFMKSFRKTDVICRYGGEEFLVILPASNIEGACVAAEKARNMIANYRFEFEGQVIPVTMSMGVAQLIVGQEDGKDAIARADAALYESKHSGRNRVSLHTGAGIVPSNHANDYFNIAV